MIENKSLKELVNKSLLEIFLRIVSIIAGFCFLYIITQLYGSEGLGIFALYQSILMILVLLSLLGTDLASLKFVSQYLVNHNFSKIQSVYLTILKIILSELIYIIALLREY